MRCNAGYIQARHEAYTQLATSLTESMKITEINEEKHKLIDETDYRNNIVRTHRHVEVFSAAISPAVV
jgi:hypothetical protein